MAKFKIAFKPSVNKDFKSIPKKDAQRIVKRIYSLADDPFPPGAKKLSGKPYYRLRQGNYRILYEIKNDELIVNVIKIGHRRNVYQG